MISLSSKEAGGAGSDFSMVSLEVSQFLRTLARTSPRLVLLEVSKVDTLFAISDKGQFSDSGQQERTRILSQVVSVFAKNVKNRFMADGLNITLKHLAVHKDVPKVRYPVTGYKAQNPLKLCPGVRPLGRPHQLLDHRRGHHPLHQLLPHPLHLQLPVHLHSQGTVLG